MTDFMTENVTDFDDDQSIAEELAMDEDAWIRKMLS